jgi:hypothetical protein
MTLKELVLGTTEVQQTRDPYYQRFGLRANPFPANRTIIAEVLYDQQHAIERVAQLFREVIGNNPQRRAMAILAGTGGGKTHFLRYCRRTLEHAIRETPQRFLFVEFQAGSGKLQDLAKEIVSTADAFCRDKGEEDFISSLVHRLKASDDKGLLGQIHQDDLRSALSRVLESTALGFQPKDRAGQYGFDLLREVCRRWMAGATLTQTERKYLGVITRINTASMAVRVLTEAFQLARSLGLFTGVMLCLDEIETIFTRGQRPAQYQAFLQDLRFLYDEAEKFGNGYSLFLLSASTSYGASSLRNVNYPIFQRLGFDENQRIALRPIAGSEEAKKFADTYVEFERDQFQSETGEAKKRYPPLLTDLEIEDALQIAAGTDDAKKAGRANQAPLLEALHAKVAEKHAASRP